MKCCFKDTESHQVSVANKNNICKNDWNEIYFTQDRDYGNGEYLCGNLQTDVFSKLNELLKQFLPIAQLLAQTYCGQKFKPYLSLKSCSGGRRHSRN